MSRIELTIAGVGGQGSIMAGVILGSAAVTYDHKYAVQTQAYSSELRGGFAAAWVIVSDTPVEFPRVTRPDILIAQAQDALDRFAGTLKKEGVLICDTDMIAAAPENIKSVYGVPAVSIARNRLKSPRVANMAMLGALSRVADVVGREALVSAVKAGLPKGKADLNIKAFDLGYENVQSQKN